MSTNIKISFAAALAVLCAGCTDLDVPVESQYTSYPNNKEAIEAQLSGIYFKLRGNIGRRYMEGQALSSDEYTAVSYSGNWLDAYAYAHPSLHNFSYEDASLDWMTDLASGVVKANEVITSDADPSYIASARAMRAYFTFVMMDGWGDITINDPTLASQIDLEARQPRADVARWLESELKEIIPLLPTELSTDNYGKPTKYMAQALLAKLYINWAVYTASSVESYEPTATNEKLADCISVCNEIINSGKFELGPDAYRFKFAPDNTERWEAGTIKDFIYVMPYHTTEATGMQYGRSHSYKDIKKLDPSYYGEALSNSGGAYITLVPEFLKLFDLKGDERNKLVIGLSEDLSDYRYSTGGAENKVYVFDPATLEPTDVVCKDRNGDDLKLTREINLITKDNTLDVGDDINGWRQGCRTVKWFVVNSDFMNSRNQSNDVPIFRYADILLTKAEALTRQGSSSEAKDLVNQIREYVNAELLTENPTLEDIYEERGREFFDENWRRNDMIRFGHYEDEYFPHYKDFPTANFEKSHRIWPIHKSMLDLNPKWEQNPGY
ncbi:MAG: RagB/SusD family nutrient uptake outer membrane protein [Bacteroidales bacterium]|nr:RagB/SusD family nutrient uptake outer membrane protein [Bacteroidales bacterium]